MSAPIVDVIIADQFFRPDEVLVNFDDDDDEDDGSAAAAIAKKVVAKAKQKTLVLKLFIKDVANVEEDEYVVTIKGTMRYKLAMDYVSTGMLFCHVACRNPNLAKCWGEAQHLERVGIGSPPGLPNVQSSTARGKTPRIGVFLVSLKRS